MDVALVKTIVEVGPSLLDRFWALHKVSVPKWRKRGRLEEVLTGPALLVDFMFDLTQVDSLMPSAQTELQTL